MGLICWLRADASSCSKQPYSQVFIVHNATTLRSKQNAYILLAVAFSIQLILQIMNRLVLALLLSLLPLASPQKYPNCPQNIPIDTGNNTSPFYAKLLTLTTFVDYQDDGSLINAFYLYAQTGQQTEIDAILLSNKKFFLVIIAVICTVAFSLLLVVNRMGDLQLTTKAIFQKLKEKGFSSALSAFYAFITIVLLASTCINIYEIQQMIGKVHMTSCRMDALNQAFLRGTIDYDWRGMVSYAQKLQNYSQISGKMGLPMAKDYQDQTSTLFYAQKYFNSLWQQYLGIVSTYNLAYIGEQANASRRINLTTLLPNLFSNNQTALLSPLINYLQLLNQTLAYSIFLQNALNNTSDVFGNWSEILSSSSQTLNQSSADFSKDFIKTRQSLDDYASQGKYVLIVCELISALTLFCCLAGLFSLKLIQSSYDHFSLSSYKIMWTFHVLMLAANLVFLMLINQTLVYNKGMCLLADSVQNATVAKDVFPKIEETSGVRFMYGCYSDGNFGGVVGTKQITDTLGELIAIRQNYMTSESVQKIAYYSDILQKVKQSLTPYQFGIKGNISFIDTQLEAINAVTNSNFEKEGCYKHHWGYGPTECLSSEVGIVKPKSVVFLNNTQNYSAVASGCYLLTDYTSNSPSAISPTAFYKLYGNYNGKCPKSNAALAAPINQFLKYFQMRRCVFGQLIDSILNLRPLINSTTKHIVSYIASRYPLLQTALQDTPPISELRKGGNCGVVREMIQGVQNEFCINFAGSLRLVYLLAMCHIAYILFMIVFSLLYAIELRNLLKKDLNQSYSNLQFMQTSQMMASESVSSVSADERQSNNSREELAHPQQQSQK